MALTVDERIMKYLTESIAQRGGRGRRLSRIEMEMEGPSVPPEEFGMALRRLIDSGQITLDRQFECDFGFIYAIPCEQK